MTVIALPTRQMLDLSTAHLPQDLGDPDISGGLPGVDGVTAYSMRHGFLMWVPDDPTDHASNYYDPDEPFPAEVLAVQLFARANGCDYVLFDCDADTVDELPTWDW